jgi:hypothetical protein
MKANLRAEFKDNHMKSESGFRNGDTIGHALPGVLRAFCRRTPQLRALKLSEPHNRPSLIEPTRWVCEAIRFLSTLLLIFA